MPTASSDEMGVNVVSCSSTCRCTGELRASSRRTVVAMPPRAEHHGLKGGDPTTAALDTCLRGNHGWLQPIVVGRRPWAVGRHPARHARRTLLHFLDAGG
eukprot:scaffold2800_cov135-Isochrysis_galbana.AAC.6